MFWRPPDRPMKVCNVVVIAAKQKPILWLKKLPQCSVICSC